MSDRQFLARIALRLKDSDCDERHDYVGDDIIDYLGLPYYDGKDWFRREPDEADGEMVTLADIAAGRAV
jgi:hypothetical protein